MSEHEVELTENERKVLTTLGNIQQIGLTDADEDGICYGVVIQSAADRLARAVAAIIAARLADAEARAEAARLEVERGIAQFEVLASKMRNYPSTNDHAPIAGYTISADDWRAVRAHLREALRGDQ